jgi:hypothetical protein
MLPEFTRHDVACALDDVVADLMLDARIVGPPVDAIELASRLSITVTENDKQAGRAQLVRPTNHRYARKSGLIVIKPDPRPERMQWAVAHEIGECYAHCAFERLGMAPSESPANSREQIANALAGRILLPSAWFFGWDLAALKQLYSTASHELIARRMLDGEPPIIVTIFDNCKLSGRHANLGRSAPALSDLEWTCVREAHESGQPVHRHNIQLNVQAWPVHEPGWKREILRTEIRETLDADCGDTS